MKQVLLAEKQTKRSMRRRDRVLLWMGDDVMPGDTYQWEGREYTVDAIYGTHLSRSGTEARKTEGRGRSRSTGVIIDHRGGESTGVPGAGSRSH